MGNKLPLFSIVVPIYNVENYLKECLDSVVGQTFSDFECIMVNDGSTDHSESIARQYVNRDCRFAIYSQENQGLSGARNTGIQHSNGKYVVFLDSDDFIKSTALEKLSEIVEKEQPDVIVSSSIAYYDDSRKLIPREWDIPEKWNCQGQLLDIISDSPNFVLAAWCLVVKRAYLLEKQLMFYPHLKHEDELWVPQVIVNAKKIAINPNPYYCGRCDRVGSITQTPNIRKSFDKIFIVDELLRFSEKQSKENAKYIKKRCAKLVTGIVREVQKYANEKDYWKLCDELKRRLMIVNFEDHIKYKILYIACSCFGIANVSKIWNMR